MTVHTLQVNGSRGELTPLMHGRVDIEFYQTGYHTAQNMMITRYGSMVRMPGTLVQGFTKFQNRRSRMLPFEFNETQVYAIEVGHQYARFWTRNGAVVEGGAPYEIVTPWLEADLENLNVQQSGDALYVFCDGYNPRILKRMAETDWTIENYKPKDGPYLPINETDTMLTPSETGHIQPTMTSANTPAPYEVSAFSNSTDAYLAFTRRKDPNVTIGLSKGWLLLELGDGNDKVADAYWLTAGSENAETDSMPTQWEFQGQLAGSEFSWVTLDSRDGENGWAGSETRFYEFVNSTKYQRYRLRFSGGSGFDPGHSTSEIGQLAIHWKAEDQDPIQLTFSSTNGINDGDGFSDDDIGRSIRLQGGDGRWRWAEIVSIVDTRRVMTRIHGHALPDVSPISAWRLGAFSAKTGFPRTGRFFEDRLALASTPEDPLGLWLSVSSGYDNFRLSEPIVDDDGISLRLTGGNFSRINWLAEVGTLLAGTGSTLRSVGSRDGGSVLSPDNVRQRAETTTPASRITPIEVENVVLFIDRYTQRLFEAAYTYEADGYQTREVSILNEHLFAMGIEQIAWLDTPHKVCVCRRADGKLVMFSYDRDQKIAGATLVNYGDPVEDILALSGPSGTDLFLTVNRTIGGVPMRTIERMADFWRRETHADKAPVYSACSYSAEFETATDVVTSAAMAPLNGRTVGVWADGRDIGDAVVQDGSVTLPYSVKANKICVGIRLPWKLQSLRCANYGQRDGAGLGRKMRVIEGGLDLFEAAGIEIGTLSEVDKMRFEGDAEQNPDDPVPLRTGMFTMGVDDSWQNQGVFVIQGDRMYPATIRGVSVTVDGEP